MEQSTRFIGMDVHKATIVVAVTATREVGKATAFGTVPNTTAALEKLVARLRQAGSGPMKFCYEAGPCGYGIHPTLDDPTQKRRAAEERQTRRRQPGGAAPRRTADRSLGAGRGTRGNARSDPRPASSSACGARRAPAVECVSITSRADLSRWPDGVDEGASR